ncbi:MAG TPA: prenyltransferase/squalene oxidase repeat-containing protein [Bryobacteraceae bacterium]|nr:prenyltransferase/squalene oxidase repeat-containing protein [Bryobacteraceae bacterium]
MPVICAETPTAELISAIQSAQNPDGGWGYTGRSSWTEPTAFALLALASGGSLSNPFLQGARWLEQTQRADGGWAPHTSVNISTWVTAPALLALLETDRARSLQSAVNWLLSQTGEESTLVDRIRRAVLGQRLEYGQETTGWPWLAGTAGWVMPTALSLLALEKAELRGRASGTRSRAQQGREFLLARICEDGGWNYGAFQALGYQANSYPDTTGMALLALHGSSSAKVKNAADLAEKQLPNCRSAQTLCWLRMGLAAQGRSPAGAVDCPRDRGKLLDLALVVLTRATEDGRARIWGAL